MYVYKLCTHSEIGMFVLLMGKIEALAWNWWLSGMVYTVWQMLGQGSSRSLILSSKSLCMYIHVCLLMCTCVRCVYSTFVLYKCVNGDVHTHVYLLLYM